MVTSRAARNCAADRGYDGVVGTSHDTAPFSNAFHQGIFARSGTYPVDPGWLIENFSCDFDACTKSCPWSELQVFLDTKLYT